MKRSVSISIEEETLERFKEYAKGVERRSVSQLLELMMEQKLKEYQQTTEKD